MCFSIETNLEMPPDRKWSVLIARSIPLTIINPYHRKGVIKDDADASIPCGQCNGHDTRREIPFSPGITKDKRGLDAGPPMEPSPTCVTDGRTFAVTGDHQSVSPA